MTQPDFGPTRSVVHGSFTIENVYPHPPGKVFSRIDLGPTPNNPLQHEGKAVSLPAGEYRIALTADAAELGDKPVEATLYVHDRPSQELSELSGNRDLLTQIADVKLPLSSRQYACRRIADNHLVPVANRDQALSFPPRALPERAAFGVRTARSQRKPRDRGKRQPQ